MNQSKQTPSRTEALNAIRTLLNWIEPGIQREGTVETPDRVLKSYEEFFAGYKQNAKEILSKTFSETAGFKEMIILDKIEFTSFCEHHLLPVIGYASIAYIPNQKVVGISKLARIVDMYARRLQLQERMTVEVAEAIHQHLEPRGVAVFLRAAHCCMTIRGVNKESSEMKTNHFIGDFINNIELQNRFWNSIK